MALKAVLFDLDDTLIDWSTFGMEWPLFEQPFVRRVYDYVAGQAAINGGFADFEADFRQRSRYAWEGARSSLVAPHLGRILAETALQLSGNQYAPDELLAAYRWSAPPTVGAFADAPLFLTLLRQHGIKTAIVTNAFQPMWMRDIELESAGLLPYFPDYRFSAADIGYLKPHPAIFRAVLGRLGVTPEEAVFVGDNISADISGANGVGMKSVLRIVQNNGALADLIEPTAAVHTLTELPAILDQWYPDWRS